LFPPNEKVAANYPYYGAAKTILLSAGESVEDVDLKAADNVLRFFDAAAKSDTGFAIGNVAPGRYSIIARSADDGDPAKVKPIRQDSALRAKVLHEAEASKKEIQFKPCEQTNDYDLPYSLPVPPKSSE
jgi:hypothetical protein